MVTVLILIAFVIGYVFIVLEEKAGINKTAAAIITAVVCWTILALGGSATLSAGGHGLADVFGQHLEETAQIIFFLIGAMTIVQMMEAHGCFQIITDSIKTNNRRALLWLVSFITFFLSAVLDNLTTSIVMMSLCARLIDDKEDRLVFAGMIIIAANAGGAWTPIGDVTTTMLWIGGRISTLKIMGALIVPSLIAMLVPLVWFSWRMKPGAVACQVIKNAPLPVGAKRVFFLGVGTLIFVPAFKILTGLPPVTGMLLGMAVVWVVTDLLHRQDRDHLRLPVNLSRIDFSSVLFFLGILLAVAALQTAGILDHAAAWMSQHLQSEDMMTTVIGIVSSVAGNVPLTAASMGMYNLTTYPMDSKFWELLAYAVGAGGSILVTGSAAGVVVMGMVGCNFLWYLKRITTIALVGYFAGIGAYLVLYRMFS